MIREYTCKGCGYYIELEDEDELPIACTECGSKNNSILYRERPKVESGVCNINATMKENVRYSYSLGINPDDPKQVAAAKIRHPGAEFRKDTGQMIIHNRTEKKLRMKQAGMIEYG